MKKYEELLWDTSLFKGISKEDIIVVLRCMEAVNKNFEKQEFIFHPGSSIQQIGIVISGSLLVMKEDYWGNRTILAQLGRGELFGEAFAYAGIDNIPVGVITAEKSEVLLISSDKIISGCSKCCNFHMKIIKNMMHILAVKNMTLTQKMEHITKKTTREKLLSYLSLKASQAETGLFEIPFNRQELADYLSVDRSAMSKELGRMRDEGLIQFHKNQFKLNIQ